jgi:hypothetical protein
MVIGDGWKPTKEQKTIYQPGLRLADELRKLEEKILNVSEKDDTKRVVFYCFIH